MDEEHEKALAFVALVREVRQWTNEHGMEYVSDTSCGHLALFIQEKVRQSVEDRKEDKIQITRQPVEEKEVKIKMAYLMRLKHYTDKVKNTVPNDLEHKMAVIALLGYLEALEYNISQLKRYDTLTEKK